MVGAETAGVVAATLRASASSGLGEILLEDSLDIQSNEDLVADHRCALVQVVVSTHAEVVAVDPGLGREPGPVHGPLLTPSM